MFIKILCLFVDILPLAVCTLYLFYGHYHWKQFKKHMFQFLSQLLLKFFAFSTKQYTYTLNSELLNFLLKNDFLKFVVSLNSEKNSVDWK